MHPRASDLHSAIVSAGVASLAAQQRVTIRWSISRIKLFCNWPLALACQKAERARFIHIDLEFPDPVRYAAPNGRTTHVHPQASLADQSHSFNPLDRQ